MAGEHPELLPGGGGGGVGLPQPGSRRPTGIDIKAKTIQYV